MILFYLCLKAGLFACILRAFIKFEPLQTYWLFLAALYTAILAGLSWVFLIAPQSGPGQIVAWPRGWDIRLVMLLLPKGWWGPDSIGWRAWQMWLAQTFCLMALYLRLLAKFEEGALFWIILALGLGLIFF
jgi:hypothetical protein